MSLESELHDNTAAIRELIVALATAGSRRDAQVGPADRAPDKGANASDAGAGVSKALKAAPSDAPAADNAARVDTRHPWAGKTAEIYDQLRDAKPERETLKSAILAINQYIDRPQADAVLARFGAQAITPSAGKRGIDPAQYPAFFELCLDVLAGRLDATAPAVATVSS